jgi:Fe-S cluster biogenesis protein NfuA/nitrite reductase/ring-hydroxylating ferredoxin subunit
MATATAEQAGGAPDPGPGPRDGAPAPGLGSREGEGAQPRPAAAEVEGEELLALVKELSDALDQAPEGPLRELAEELVSSVVQLYGVGLERILGALAAGGEAGARLGAELAEDPFLATLMLIHDLHPVPLEDRVRGALDSVRPYMESHGGGVELLSLVDGVARIHLRGSCSDCSASAVTLELAIKQALEERAPDLEELIVEGQAAVGFGNRQDAALEGAGLQGGGPPGAALPMASSSVGALASERGTALPMAISADDQSRREAQPAWVALEGLERLEVGRIAAAQAGSQRLVVANVEGTLLAYRDACASCGGSLAAGPLSDGVLACPACARSFFLPRAGRSVDGDGLQLTPVPLLREGHEVRVALAL